MAAYNSVSDIPQTIDYEIIVYTFNHTVSGKDYVFGGITESKEKKQDTTAYAVFNEFNRVFTDKLFSADFSVYTIEKLANIRSEAERFERYFCLR